MSENGKPSSVQALDAFAEWMRRVEQKFDELFTRVLAIEGRLQRFNDAPNAISTEAMRDAVRAYWGEKT